MYHHSILNASGPAYVWEEVDVCFDEMLISWNASRPGRGDFLIFLSVKIDCWSCWHLYSSWGASGQCGGSAEAEDIRIVKDTIEILHGKSADGFRIRIEAVNGASIQQFRSLHVHTGGGKVAGCKKDPASFSSPHSIDLPVPLISQIALVHPRSRSFCSPVSTASVISYLLEKKIEPVEFALNVQDRAFDIFGNWVLNIAHAASILGSEWHCWVQKLQGFENIYEQLTAQIPVIASVRGPLKGSAFPYAEGHLVAVKGFDCKKRRVLCMDPAFPTDAETDIGYDFEDFMNAWRRRGCVAYVFSPKA
jgi:hypothetical protein